MGLKKDKRIVELFNRLSLVDKTIKKSDTARSVVKYIEASQAIDNQIEGLTVQMDSITRQIKSAQSIQRQVKETSDILLNHGPSRISLILKNQSGNDYIKARCYWQGKQREVQIAPLSGIVNQLSALSIIDSNKISHDLSNGITWDICRAETTIYNAILLLARIKFQRYIVDRIDHPAPMNHPPEPIQQTPIRSTTSKNESEPEKGSWYEGWRERTGG